MSHQFSLTTFSPSGKLVQIEYALNAVAAGKIALGIKASDGVVIATEKKPATVLEDEASVKKINLLTKSVGITYAGMGPDYRVLTKKARKIAQKYQLTYQESMPVSQLVRGVATTVQEYTQSGGVRPFGVSLLILGMEGKCYRKEHAECKYFLGEKIQSGYGIGGCDSYRDLNPERRF
eukprot:58897_1